MERMQSLFLRLCVLLFAVLRVGGWVRCSQAHVALYSPRSPRGAFAQLHRPPPSLSSLSSPSSLSSLSSLCRRQHPQRHTGVRTLRLKDGEGDTEFVSASSAAVDAAAPHSTPARVVDAAPLHSNDTAPMSVPMPVSGTTDPSPRPPFWERVSNAIASFDEACWRFIFVFFGLHMLPSAPPPSPHSPYNATSQRLAFFARYIFARPLVALRLAAPLLVSLSLLWQAFLSGRAAREVALSSFLSILSDSSQDIERVVFSAEGLSFAVRGKNYFARCFSLSTLLPSVVQSLLDAKIPFAMQSVGSAWSSHLPSLVITLVNVFLIWKATGKMNPLQSDKEMVGRRVDRDVSPSSSALSWQSVAGLRAPKRAVAEIVQILKSPESYLSRGVALPSGVLLAGPPGTGKTLLARIAAQEAGVPFFSVSGSEFIELFVGRGAARVRKLFQDTERVAPAIIFIDEIDSIGRSRAQFSLPGSFNGNAEQESALNQLLACMDGLHSRENRVVVLAATNRLDVLDPALLRAGRFDRVVQCSLPDRAERKELFSLYASRLKLHRDVDVEKLVSLTPGASGADICTIVNEAAICTVQRGALETTHLDFDMAIKGFYASRPLSVAGIAEAASEGISRLPEWLRNLSAKK